MAAIIELQKVAYVVDGEMYFTASDFALGDVLAELTSADTSANPVPIKTMMTLIFGEGDTERSVELEVTPFLPASHPRGEPFFIRKNGGAPSSLAYFRDQLFAFRPLPRTPSEWTLISSQIKDGFPGQSGSVAPASGSNDLEHMTTRATYIDLVRKRSSGEPGLLTAYLRENPRVDAALIPMKELGNLTQLLYPPTLLDVLEKEGHWDYVVETDLWFAIGNEVSDRRYKLDRILREIVDGYRQILAEPKPSAEPRQIGTPHANGTEKPRSWHDVLEVSVTATLDDVQAAYRRKIALYHPDRVADLGVELRALAEKHTKEINRAYDEARKTRARS